MFRIWSYFQVAQTTIGGLFAPVYREMINNIYAYSSPGYCDWTKYQTSGDFAAGLKCYIDLPCKDDLEFSGIDIKSFTACNSKFVREYGCSGKIDSLEMKV